MRWFSTACLWFQYKSKCTRMDLLEFIFLLLSIPCFKASHFFFKRTYALQQRELLRLGRECIRLGGEDYSLEFDNLSLGP